MDIIEKERYFKQQLPQLKGWASRLSKKYNIDYDESQSKVFERFCEVIDKYDKNKAGIYTFLSHQLLILNNQIKSSISKMNGFKHVNIDILDYFNIEYKNRFIKIIEFYDYYELQLSERGKMVVGYILDAPIGGVNRIPSYNSVSKYFCKVLGWKNTIFREIWKEIKLWWNNSDFIYS
jgi:hypothetical protein